MTTALKNMADCHRKMAWEKRGTQRIRVQCKYCVALPMGGNDCPRSAAVLERDQAFGDDLDDLFVNFVGA